MFEIFMSYLWIVAPIVWVCFIAYAVWYSTRAKSCAPISKFEARQLWFIHRRGARCESRKWRQVRHSGRTVGFECGCGYKHVQHRPLVVPPPAVSSVLNPEGFRPVQASRRT